jgi:hypothetical protein
MAKIDKESRRGGDKEIPWDNADQVAEIVHDSRAFIIATSILRISSYA